MAEIFMKLLPQVIYAVKSGMLDNPFTHKPLKAQLEPEAVARITQIWKKGVYCLIERDPVKSEIVTNRQVIYSKELQEVDDNVEVELKPSFSSLMPVRDVTYSSVWREITAQVPIRYALEGLDLVTLASKEGGFFKEYKEGNFPYFENYDDILNSIDTTAFVSKQYFESSIDILFSEFLYFYNILFVQLHRIVEEIKTGSYDEDKIKQTVEVEELE